MRRLQQRLKAEIEWVTPLPPLVLLRLNKNIEVARNDRILHAWLREYEVIDMTDILNKSYCLNLDKKFCDCCMWQLSGLPCQHAICAIMYMNYSDFGEFVNERLRIPTYMRTYGAMIHPVPNQRSWADGNEEQLQTLQAWKAKEYKDEGLEEERKRKPVST